MNLLCDVRRFEPDVDTKPRYERYRLDVDPTETVLDVLIRIYRHHDPALSFRFACGVIKCGECAITVNESPCLACEKLVEPEMKIDPLPNFPLIKDLVIDRRKVFDRIFALLPALSQTKGRRVSIDFLWLARGNLSGEHCEREGVAPTALPVEGATGDPRAGVPVIDSLDTATVNNYVRLTKCFECLICQSSCPVSADTTDKFVGPLGLLWLAQMLPDPRSESDLQQNAKRALEMCEKCGICSGVCPCSEDILMLALTTLEKG